MTYVLYSYALMSVITFVAYGLDKRASQRSRQRIRETTLHLLELIGGFPGAFAAQRFFRHKRRKTRFLVWSWLIVALHAAGWSLWIWAR